MPYGFWYRIEFDDGFSIMERKVIIGLYGESWLKEMIENGRATEII